MKNYVHSFLRKGLWALLSGGFLLLLVGVFLYIYLQSQLPNVNTLKHVQLQVPLQIYSHEGLLIQEYGEKRRIPMDYQDIPPMLVKALLATEDQRFFEHPGVDIFGLGRAAVHMMQTGTRSQGGSTITMQVARNFFLERKKTFLRKFNEILLAIKIDHDLPKEKILELYLNKIYLGNRAYGVGAAAQVYYGKSLKELSLAQLAMIAGLPQAPSTQNPIANPIAAKKRRDHVLARLLEDKNITIAQYDEAVQEPVTASLHSTVIQLSAPYVAEMIRQSLYDHFGSKAYTKGYQVYTTIRAPLQSAAEEVLKHHLLTYDSSHGYHGPVAHLDPRVSNLPVLLARYAIMDGFEPALVKAVKSRSAEVMMSTGHMVTLSWSALSWARPALPSGYMGARPQQASQILHVGDVIYIRQTATQWTLTQLPDVEGALVALDPKNGAIEALVGGFDFKKSKYNRATQSTRQPGSTFKPFIYAAALDKGYSLATLINDAPIVMDDPSRETLWRPQNVHHDYSGPTRLKEALLKSKNLVSIRILNDIGLDYAIEFVTRFGFNKANLPRALPLALGSLAASPLDLTTAYAVFANGGFKVEPYLIDRIADHHGHSLFHAMPLMACENCDAKQSNPDAVAPRVLSEETAFLMNTALRGVVESGTAGAARVLNRHDLAGKTGSTNDQVDAWFSGFTPDLVVTTWVGFDTPRSLRAYGAQLALPMWIDFMKIALAGVPEKPLKMPEHVVSRQINPRTGLVVPDNAAGMTEYFREDEVPAEDRNTAVPTAPGKSAPADEHLF